MKFYSLALSLLFLCEVVSAQQDSLIYRYRRLSSEYQQSIKMAEANLIGTEELYKSSKSEYLPKLDLNGDYTYYNTPLRLAPQSDGTASLLHNRFTVGAWITQPIYTGGRLNAEKKIALAQYEGAGSYVALSKQEVFLNSDALYWNAVAKNEVYNLSLSYEEIVGDFVKVIQDKVDEGLVGNNELYQSKVRENDAHYDVIKGEKERDVSIMQLNRLAGLPLENQSLIMDSILIVNWQITSRATVDQAIEKRPETRVKESELNVYLESEKQMSSMYNPKMGVAVGGIYGAPSPELGLDPGTNLLVTANLSIPLFYWGIKNKQVEAKRQVSEQSRLELAQVKDIIALEVNSSYYELTRSQEQVDFAKSALENAEKNVDVMLDRYNEGLSSVLEVLDSQLFWQKSYFNYIEAKFELNLAYSNYLKAIGALSVTQ